MTRNCPITAFFEHYDLWFLLGAAGFGFLGGFVKGAVGFALPLVAMSGISMFATPAEAIAAIILPAFFTNIFQAGRQGLGPAMATAKEFWRFSLIVAFTILLVAQVVPYIPINIFFIVLGFLVMTAALIQLFGISLPYPETPGQKRGFEVSAGLVAGGMGGLGGFWGPATVMYLTALQVDKALFIRTQGLVYLIGSIMLVGGHLASGVLNQQTWPLSFAMLLPVAIGMVAGTFVQDKLDQKLFKKIVLIVLCCAGLNLLRRGLF